MKFGVVQVYVRHRQFQWLASGLLISDVASAVFLLEVKTKEKVVGEREPDKSRTCSRF